MVDANPQDHQHFAGAQLRLCCALIPWVPTSPKEAVRGLGQCSPSTTPPPPPNVNCDRVFKVYLVCVFVEADFGGVLNGKQKKKSDSFGSDHYPVL